MHALKPAVWLEPSGASMFHGFSMSCPVALNSIMQDCMISVQSEHAFRKRLGLSPLIFICRFGSANQSAVVFFFVCIQDQECSNKNIYRKRGAHVQR